MENWKELLASFGLWLLVEDISDDGDGKGDNLQLTKDGELFVSEIQQELDKAREEGIREYIELLQGLEHYEGLKMIRGLQGLDNHEKREYYDIKKRFKELSKLTTK